MTVMERQFYRSFQILERFRECDSANPAHQLRSSNATNRSHQLPFNPIKKRTGRRLRKIARSRLTPFANISRAVVGSAGIRR